MSYSDLGTVYGRQLAQSEPSGTSATQVFTPDSKDRRVVLTYFTIVNDTTSDVIATIYHDDDGTTYTSATQVIRLTVPANDTITEHCYIPVTFGGNIAVQTATGSALTFSLYGTDYAQSR